MTLILFVSFMALNSCDQGVGPLPECHLTELDSTSHSFAWTITELGDGGGSILRDVAIVNDTLVYAVGEIRLKDRLGNWDSEPYGLAIWNGESWRLEKIPYHDFGSTQLYPGNLNAVCAFGADDIYVSSSANLLHWNGTNWTEKAFFMTSVPFNGQVAKIWGSNSSDVYCVGGGGAVYNFNGNLWQKIQSGTTLPIRDIWGATDPVTGEQTILAIASGSSPEEGKKLLSIKGTTVTHLPDEGLSWRLSGIWFVPYCKYYIVGAGIHQKPSLLDGVWSVYDPGEVTSYESGGVRGSALNNVFVVGSFFEIAHFNGSTWYNYRNEIPFSGGALGGVAVTENLIVAVGLNGQKAVAVIGRR